MIRAVSMSCLKLFVFMKSIYNYLQRPRLAAVLAFYNVRFGTEAE